MNSSSHYDVIIAGGGPADRALRFISYARRARIARRAEKVSAAEIVRRIYFS